MMSKLVLVERKIWIVKSKVNSWLMCYFSNKKCVGILGQIVLFAFPPLNSLFTRTIWSAVAVATASQLLLVYLDSSTFSQYPIRTVTVLSKSILTHFGAHFGLGFPSQYYWRFQTKRNKINLTFFTLVPISRRLSILSGLVSPKLVSLTGVKLQINIGNQCNLVF